MQLFPLKILVDQVVFPGLLPKAPHDATARVQDKILSSNDSYPIVFTDNAISAKKCKTLDDFSKTNENGFFQVSKDLILTVLVSYCIEYLAFDALDYRWLGAKRKPMCRWIEDIKLR